MHLSRNGYIERGTSTCASRKSQPSVRPWLFGLCWDAALGFQLGAETGVGETDRGESVTVLI